MKKMFIKLFILASVSSLIHILFDNQIMSIYNVLNAPDSLMAQVKTWSLALTFISLSFIFFKAIVGIIILLVIVLIVIFLLNF